MPHLNWLLAQHKTKLFFQAGCISELNAAKGLVKILNLHPKHFTINSKNIHPMKQDLKIRFDFNSRDKLEKNGLVLNHEPYKYFLNNRHFKNERNRIRKSMGLSQTRKVIVFSCTHANEIEVVLDAYDKLISLNPPFLIIALREADPLLASKLIQRGFKATSRNDSAERLSGLGKHDIIILNTASELLHFFKIANLAVMGHDRNLFEPACLDIPIIYFKRPLNMNSEERRILGLFNLGWRKNKIAKRLMDQTGGAIPIHPTRLKDQMMHVLNHPEKMILRTRQAVRRLNREIVPVYRRRVLDLLALGLNLRREVRERVSH